MEKIQLLKRLHDLEEEIELLKAELEPSSGRTNTIRLIQKFFYSAISPSTLLSFLVVIGISTIGYVAYDVGYFENFQNISSIKKLSELYRELGDKMMAYSEWEAAEEAYSTAIEINPNNIEANYGLLKARVFQPLEGDNLFIPEVVNGKLEFLLKLRPDDPQVYFLKGTQYMFQNDNENAKLWFAKAIDKDPSFVGNYINLGYVNLRDSDIKEAMRNYTIALEKDKNSSIVHANLGNGYLLSMDFNRAIEHLIIAYKLSPGLFSAITLGNAYRYSGDFASALYWHQFAQFVMKEPGIENERWVGSLFLLHYMPEQLGGVETIQKYVEVGSVSQKQIILHYALSFDYALSNKFEDANREFDAGYQLDLSRQYIGYVMNNIGFMKNLLKLDKEVQVWFEQQQTKLASP